MSRVFFYEMSIVFSQVAFKAWNLQSTCMYNFQKMCIIIYIYVYTYYVTYIIFLPILRICIYKLYIYLYYGFVIFKSKKGGSHLFFTCQAWNGFPGGYRGSMGWMWVRGLDALGFRFRNYSRFSQDLEKWQQHIQSIEVSRKETNRKIFLKSWRLVLFFLCRVCTGVVGGALLNYDGGVF